MRILVTGGAGYIGGAVAAELVKHGHDVIVLDNLSSGHRAAVSKQAVFVEADVGDRARLDQIFRASEIDGVMHFAASTEVKESMLAPAKYFRNNAVNTLNLLEAMREHGIAKFVFSSTAALYGRPCQIPIPESLPLKPTNPYGESKLMVERMLQWFNRVYGLRYASLRYFNAAGASDQHGEDHRPESHLIPLVLQVASGKRESVSIYGTDYETHDGTCVRDYIHISDLACAHLLAFKKLGREPEPERLIYNLGNSRGHSVREVIEAARFVTGRKILFKEGPRRPGDPPALIASSEQITRDLGWKPKVAELESIIQSAWEWRQKNPEGYVSSEKHTTCFRYRANG
jgi:UDP-glucose 4-epimerase